MSIISFVFSSRRTSLCFQFDHSRDVFRDKDEHCPEAIVGKRASISSMLAKISSFQTYEDDDLLNLRAKEYGSYAGLIVRNVFSTQELTTSILPLGGSQSSRPPIDVNQLDCVHREYTNTT